MERYKKAQRKSTKFNSKFYFLKVKNKATTKTYNINIFFINLFYKLNIKLSNVLSVIYTYKTF